MCGRIPLLAEEGWTRHEENVPLPIWRGRGGAKRKPERAKPQEKFGEIFRPEHFAKLTTPSAALRWLRDFLLMPQPPLLCKEGNLLSECDALPGYLPPNSGR